MGTFIGNLLRKIGSIFTKLVESSQEAYEGLSQEEKDALLQGSGVIAIINEYKDGRPSEVLQKIYTEFPKLAEGKELRNSLFQLAKGFNLIPVGFEDDGNDGDKGSLEITLIKLIQRHLDKVSGNIWAAISNGLAQLLAVLLAPKGAKFAKFGLLIEYVYQTYIKKK